MGPGSCCHSRYKRCFLRALIRMSVGPPFSTEQIKCSHRIRFLAESPLAKALRCWIILEWGLTLGELSVCTEDTSSAPPSFPSLDIFFSMIRRSYSRRNCFSARQFGHMWNAVESSAGTRGPLCGLRYSSLWDTHPLWEPWGCVQLRATLQVWFAKLSLKPSCREGNWPPIQGGWSLCGEMGLISTLQVGHSLGAPFPQPSLKKFLGNFNSISGCWWNEGIFSGLVCRTSLSGC